MHHVSSKMNTRTCTSTA